MRPAPRSVTRCARTAAMSLSLVSVASKLVRYLSDLPLRPGQHRAVVGRLAHLVGRPGLRKALLQIVERIRPHRAALAAQYYESDRSIQLRNFIFGKRASDLLRHAQAGNPDTSTITLLDVVIDVYLAVTNEHVRRESAKLLPEFAGD